MTTKLVVRLLGQEGELLGWGVVMAEARGDGALWMPEGPPLTVVAEQAGVAATVSVHWADINIETRVEAFPIPVNAGQKVPLTFGGPMIKIGDPPQNLPAVTVRRSVTVGVPVGEVGARQS